MAFDEVSGEISSLCVRVPPSSYFECIVYALLNLDLPDQPEAATGQKDQDAEDAGSAGAPLHPDRRCGWQVGLTNQRDNLLN